MNNTFCSLAILLVLLVFCIGCQNKASLNAIDKEDSHKYVIDKAIVRFDEINGLQAHKKYDISVRETSDEWKVFFDGKIKIPGNHAFVTIIKSTGEIKYFQGE